MSVHESNDLHRQAVAETTALFLSNPKIKWDGASATRLRYRNAVSKLMLGPGEMRDPDTGIATLLTDGSARQDPVPKWLVSGVVPAEHLSIDPNTFYLNGMSLVSSHSPPKLMVHAHLQVCLESEWEQALEAMGHESHVALPQSYRVNGGLAWYRTPNVNPMDAESDVVFTARLKGAPEVLIGPVYRLVFELMTIADERPVTQFVRFKERTAAMMASSPE